MADLILNAITIVTNHAKNAHISINNQVMDADLLCDKLRIEQVIVNILFNAIKFSPSGTGIEITSQIKD